MDNKKLINIARFQYLSDDKVAGFTHPMLAEAACKGGAKWVQLRVKNKSLDEWEKIAFEVKEVTDYYGATLIINDSVAIAKQIKANGVHLGKEDMPPNLAREM